MSNILLTRKSTPLALLSSMALATLAHSAGAAVVIDFNQEKPTENVIVYYDPTGGTPQNLNWISTPATPNRQVGQIFTLGSDDAPAYNVSSITMKLAVTAPDFSVNSGFTISFFEVANAGAHPNTPTSEALAILSGNVQATSSATPGYFTFDLGEEVHLAAGKSYSFVLAWDAPQASQHLLLAYNGVDPNMGYLWFTNPNWTTASSQSAIFYLQGTEAIPEAETLALLPIGALVIGLIARRRRKLAAGV